jgi:hypothetical protein
MMTMSQGDSVFKLNVELIVADELSFAYLRRFLMGLGVILVL